MSDSDDLSIKSDSEPEWESSSESEDELEIEWVHPNEFSEEYIQTLPTLLNSTARRKKTIHNYYAPIRLRRTAERWREFPHGVYIDDDGVIQPEDKRSNRFQPLDPHNPAHQHMLAQLERGESIKPEKEDSEGEEEEEYEHDESEEESEEEDDEGDEDYFDDDDWVEADPSPHKRKREEEEEEVDEETFEQQPIPFAEDEDEVKMVKVTDHTDKRQRMLDQLTEGVQASITHQELAEQRKKERLTFQRIMRSVEEMVERLTEIRRLWLKESKKGKNAQEKKALDQQAWKIDADVQLSGENPYAHLIFQRPNPKWKRGKQGKTPDQERYIQIITPIHLETLVVTYNQEPFRKMSRLYQTLVALPIE